MKKVIASLILICFLGKAFSQPVIVRAGSGNTVQDARAMQRYNLYIPRYADSVEANLPTNIGIDSCGAIFYSYADKAIFFRSCSPKKWVQILPSGGITGLSAWLLNGNDRSLYPDSAVLGTTSANPFYIVTSNFKRIGFHQDGIQDSTADVLALGIDTATGFLAYARAGGGGGGGGGGSNTSIGAGFKIAVGVNATNIKSLRAGYAIIADSATTGEVKFTLDSATVYGVVRSTINDSIDANTVTFRNPDSGDTLVTTPSAGVVLVKSFVAGFGTLSANVTDTTFGSAVDTTVMATVTSVRDTATDIRNSLITIIDTGQPNDALLHKTGTNEWTAYIEHYGNLDGIVGTTSNFPLSGDLVIVNTGWINKQINHVIINSQNYQRYTFDYITGTLTLSDTLATGDHFTVKNTPYVLNYEVVAEPVGGYFVLDYPSVSNLSETSNTWTTTSGTNSWSGLGLSGTNFTGNGEYISQYFSSNGHNVMLGFNTSNLNQDYTNYEYGLYIQSSGGDIFDITSGTPGSSRGTVTNGQWVRLMRTGTTVTLAKSTDKISWTTLYTFGGSSTGTLYLNTNVYSGATAGLFVLYNPQYK